MIVLSIFFLKKQKAKFLNCFYFYFFKPINHELRTNSAIFNYINFFKLFSNGNKSVSAILPLFLCADAFVDCGIDNFFSFFFFNFVIKYFQFKLNKRVFFFVKKFSFSNLTFLSSDYTLLFTFLFLKFKKFQTQIGRGFFLKEFFESVFFFFFFKDSQFFGSWLKKTTERIFFKNHKKFFYFLYLFFIKYFRLLSYIYGVTGFRLNISGKISLTGSAKKKNFLLRVGSFSSSKKSLKVSAYNDYIWTAQGSLGLKLFLSFN